MLQTLQFALFSFNRGNFLQHCVDSIERFAPGCSVHIIDDASDDPDTCRIIQSLSQRHRITIVGKTGETKHGGLYANMQRALDCAEADQPLCFMQDDTQLVRPLTSEDIAAVDRFFTHLPGAAFLSPTFIRRSSKARPVDALTFDTGAGVYWPQHTRQKAGVHYSDIVITLPSRLHRVGWQFQAGEPANEQQARANFGRMGILFAPFAMWLPLVPTFRGKGKTLALRLGERRSSCGFHPIAPMNPSAVNAMRCREPAAFPYAEDFLSVIGRELDVPWRFNGLQGQRALKWLNSLEVRWRRFYASALSAAEDSPP